MPLNNIITPQGEPVWIVEGVRNGYGIRFEIAISDSDAQATEQERDDVVNAMATELVSVGFTITAKYRNSVTPTSI